MENTGIIQEFAEYLRNVKNRSELTISAYTADLEQFCRILGVEDFSEVTRRDVESKYISALVKDGLSASSRARKLSSVRTFYRWANRNGVSESNPIEFIDSPKLEKKEPKTMSDAEVEEVMVAAKCSEGSEANIFRDIAILSLLFNSGIRRAELVNIKLADLDLTDGHILIHGKGMKERVCYINNNARAILSEYVTIHRGLMKKANESPYLFCSRQGAQLSMAQVNNIVRKHFSAAGLEGKGYTVHTTRRTFATACYRQSGDILAVSRILGHSSSEVTTRYIGAAEDMKRKVACSVNF